MTDMPAELSTVELAARFGGRVVSVPNFDSLFEALEAAQMPLGVESRLRCFVVLSHLAALGVRFDDAGQLKAHLAPVLAGSRYAQDDIAQMIDAWMASERPATPRRQEETLVREGVPVPVKRVEQADRTGQIVALSLAALAIVAVVSVVAAQVSTGKAPDFSTAIGNVVSNPQPVLRLNFGLNSVWQSVLENVLSRLGLATIVVLLGSAYFAWSREVKGRLIRRISQADLLRAFRLNPEPPGWFRTVDARAAFDRLKRVRWSNTDQIDVAESVARSTRSGGLPIVAYKRLRELPTYVLLVDRSLHDDHANMFALEIEAALVEARIVYSRYDFSGTLERLNPVRRGGKEPIVDREHLPFSVVATRHAGERLILVGAGAEFFEIAGPRVDGSGRRIVVQPGTPRPNLIHLREFGSASLFTPAPFSAWGEHERQLGEVGFTVYSADVRGVENLAAQLIKEFDSSSSNLVSEEASDIAEFLLWLDHHEMRLTSDVPPSGDEIRVLVHNLRIWAGRPEVFTLVGAIAAFPKIAPGLTFVLGALILPPKKNMKARATGEPAIDSTLFGQLVRLPWIRNGRMPDWLRIGILNGLRPAQRNLVRQILMFVLSQTEDALDASRRSASLRELAARFEVACEKELAPKRLGEAADSIPPGEMRSANERIFFSVLRDKELDPELDVIRPEAPEIIAHRMDVPEQRRRARLRYAIFGVAAIAALLQPSIFSLLSVAASLAYSALAPVTALVLFGGIGDKVQLAVAAFLLLAAAQWIVNVARREPQSFPRLRQIRLSQQLIYDPRLPAVLAIWLSIFTLGMPTGPGSLVAALAMFVWVLLVTPERWWQSPGVEEVTGRRLPGDWIGGTLGTIFVFAIWSIVWLFGVTPKDRYSASELLTVGAVFGAIAWMTSNAFMRRWVLGPSFTWLPNRLAFDAGFAVTGYCLLQFALRPLLTPLGLLHPWDDEAPLTLATLCLYYVGVRSNLGLRSGSRVWLPALNATMLGLLTVTVLGFAADPDQEWGGDVFKRIGEALGGGEYTPVAIGIFLVGLLTCSASTALAVRRMVPSSGYSITLSSIALLVSAYVVYLLLSLQDEGAKTSIVVALRFISGGITSVDLERVVWQFVLPLSAAFWPTLAFISQHATPTREGPPRWWAVLESPWWSVPIMWLVAVAWNPELSLSPLALLVAIIFAWRHGERALAAISVGALPFLIRLGSGAFLPGDVFPAIVIVFWARFVADETFRQRLLRRERLPWAEAMLMALLLLRPPEIQLPPLFGAPAALVINPDWLRATVAFVIGSSRMPFAPFVVGLIGAWVVATNLLILQDLAGGFSTGAFLSTLVVLYAGRMWRTYSVGYEPTDMAEDRARTIRVFVAGACLIAMIVLVEVLRLGPWAPYVDVGIGRLALDLSPSTGSALALMAIGGLIACNLWSDRLPIRDGWLAKVVGTLPVPLLILTLTVGGYFALLRGVEPLSVIGLRFDANYRGTQSLGYVFCFAAFFIFGAAVRIVSERRDQETLLQAARRLWIRRRQAAKEDLRDDRQYAAILDQVPFPYSSPTAHRLVQAMAAIYPEQRDALRFAGAFGIDSGSISPGTTPRDLWYDVLRQLAQNGRLREAVRAAYKQFSTKPEASFLYELLEDALDPDDRSTDQARSERAMRKK